MAFFKSSGKKSDGRIFINYRRSDASGFAGRLSDSLERYFGENRVFRDVEDIAGGATFGDIIGKTLNSANAVIVLIGEKWLTETKEDGTRRIDDPEDWVAREIAATLENGTPLFPVLLEGTPIPRAEDLPEKIRPLVHRNAIHISDQRWEHDVTRLSQVIALDIPGSLAERQLALANRFISIALFLSVFLTLGTVTYQLIFGYDKWFPAGGSGQTRTDTEHLYLGFGPSALTFAVILCCVTALAFFVRLVDPSRRSYVYAAILTGGIGSFVCFVLIWPIPTPYESIVNVFGSTVTAFAMVSLMSLSGLKTK